MTMKRPFNTIQHNEPLADVIELCKANSISPTRNRMNTLKGP